VRLSAVPKVSGAPPIDLRIALEVQGPPDSARHAQDRVRQLQVGEELVLPVLIVDPAARETLGLRELFVRLWLRLPHQEPSADYGTVSLEADVPGSDILIDGVLVGRTSDQNPTLLRRVLAGAREIRVRDLSGRLAVQTVVVEPDKTAVASARILPLALGAAPEGLRLVGPNPQGFDVYWRPKDGTVVVTVPAGEFLMGSVEGEGEPTERPQRRIHLSAFLIDKTEVTWRQFRRFARSTSTSLPPEPLWGSPDDYPVVNARWEEARAYCEWVGGRLPTEAEWEKAARGTDGRKYSWGDAWDPRRCNSFEGGPHGPEAAGSFPDCITPYGALDMSGSVWEWCADWHAERYDPADPSPPDPRGPASGTMRVLRGGSWLVQGNWLRAAYRHRNDPAGRNVHHGFRCAQELPAGVISGAPVAVAKPVRASPRHVRTSIEVLVSRPSGKRERCVATEEGPPHRKVHWRIAVGEDVRCGVAPLEAPAGSSFVADLSTVTQLLPEEVLGVDLSLAQQASATEVRQLFFAEGGAAYLPLALSSDAEVLLRLEVRPAAGETASACGALSVRSDMDGAELLLDGGRVGAVVAGKELILEPVIAGEHELRARHPSGRELGRYVRVEPDRKLLVRLEAHGPQERSPDGLAPIGKNLQGYEEFRRERDGAVLVRIPAGEFLMGNAQTEREPLEHRVELSEYFIDKTEVTWGQYMEFAAATQTPLPARQPFWGVHADHPVVFVRWEEADAYCQWVGGRLPTEAEWEKAARGVDDRKYPWGNEEPNPSRAVFQRSWGFAATDPVGSHPAGASPYGLMDMGGNVWEWCADWYDEKYYATSPSRDPKGPSTGMSRVLRGGSWDSRPAVTSCSCRGWGIRGYREGDFGFRCARGGGR
jgi:formylglycine-generating enzyme required for sulfatase activity